MGVFQTALANLAALAVGGVISYRLDDTPGALSGAQLPALVILPELGGESPGLEPSGFSAGDGRLVMHVGHALLVAPVIAGMRHALPTVAALVDAYLAALAADPTLGGALPVALMCRVRVGVVRYAGVDYHGAVFVHEWTMNV